MATNTVRLQNIFDGANDFATPTADIDSVIADVVLFAEDKEFADFYLPKVVTKDTATANENELGYCSNLTKLSMDGNGMLDVHAVK